MKRKRKPLDSHSHSTPSPPSAARFNKGSILDSAREPEPEVFRAFKMKISWHPMPDPEVKRLPRSVKSRMSGLMARINTEAPAILGELRELVRKYPKILCFQNWLCNCLRVLDLDKEAMQICETLYREHPDYIFGRTSLAEMLIEEGRIEEAEKIMGGPGSALPFQYPRRKVFHISEVRHWLFIQGRIHFFQGRLQSARDCRDLLDDLEPNSHAVEELDRLLDDDNMAMLQALEAGFQRLKKVMGKKTPATKAAKVKAPKKAARPLPGSRKSGPGDDGHPELFSM